MSAAPAPAMPKVFLRLMIPLDVSSIEVGGLLSVAKETRVFILKSCDVIKPLFRRNDVIVLHSDWLPRKQRCHLAGISSIFPVAFPVHKGQMSSGFLRDRTLFHQLGKLEYECFHLAGALATDKDVRVALLETFTAGKYPHASRFRFRLVVLGTRHLRKHHS